MSLPVILAFIKKLLPKERIGAFILGVIGSAIALFLGANSVEMKDKFCAAELPPLPPLDAPAPSPLPSGAPEKK